MIRQVTKASDIKPYSIGIMVFDTQTIHHEGDERSRTNPGHGYPAHTETINTITYYQCDDESDVKNWIIRNKDKTNYSIIRANKVSVEQKLEVKLIY